MVLTEPSLVKSHCIWEEKQISRLAMSEGLYLGGSLGPCVFLKCRAVTKAKQGFLWCSVNH